MRTRSGSSYVLVAVVQTALLFLQLLWIPPSIAQPDKPPPAPPSAGRPDEDASEGKRHEIVGKRTETAKFFEHEDGTLTAELYSGPVHFEHEGKWHEIDTDLVSGAENGWGWKNRAGAFSASFAEDPNGNRLVRLRDGDGAVAFGLEGMNTTRDPVVDGSTITYPEVFPGVDLQFEVRNSDLKEVLILKEPPRLPRNGKAHYRFPLRAHGLRAVQEKPGGEILFVDDHGTPQFGIPKLWMNDSAVDPHSGEPAFSDDLSLTLVEHGKAQFAEVDVPAEWLLDPARVYPVYVDPTVTPNPLVATKDTFVQSNILNTPQDGASELKIGTYDGSTVARSLVKFDVSSLRGKDLVSAKLSLYNHWSWSCTPKVAEVYRITDSWGGDVTWPNKPSFAGTRVDSKSAAHGYNSTCGNARIVFDQVLEPVNYWLNHPETNHGFGLKAADEWDTYGWKRFHSSENSQKPHLTVEYQERVNSAPYVPVDLSPPSGTQGGTRPTLRARYRDPDAGDGGFVEFRVTTSPGGGSTVASGDGTFAEPGFMSEWQVPPARLVKGTKYYWQARSFDHNARSAWSEPAFIYDVAGCTTTPPNVPSQPQPPSGSSGTSTPTLSVSYSDPNGDAGTVHFTVYNSSNVVVGEGDSPTVGSGSRASWTVPDGAMNINETYSWDAFANDGCESSGRTGRFTYTAAPPINNAPYTPSNMSPADGASGGPQTTFCATFNDPDIGNSGLVMFAFYQNNVWKSTEGGSHVESGQQSCWTAPSGYLSSGSSYQWEAYAYDGKAYSNVTWPRRTYNVTTEGAWPPYQPTQLQPPTWTRSLNQYPELSALYNDVDTGDDGQVYFEVYQLDFAGNRMSPMWTGGWGSVAVPNQRSSWPIARALDVGRDYQWRAIAWDGDQWGPWSEWASYSVTAPNRAPTVPTDLSPFHPTTSSNLQPRLTGRYNDPDAGDLGYLFFEVYEVKPEGTRYYTYSAYSQYVAPGQMAHVDVPVGVLQPWKTYEWRANAFDDFLQSESTAWRRYDTIEPPTAKAPVIRSRTHSNNTWSRNRTAEFDWDVPFGGDPTKGYAVDFTSSSETKPTGAKTTATPSWIEYNIPDGTWWFHVRAANENGQWGDTGHYRVLVDATPPGAPVVTSSTHPNQGEWTYSNNDPQLSWSAPPDVSWVQGYSWVFDRKPDTTPPEKQNTQATSASFTDIAEGQHYFHIRAVDNAQNWGPTRHFSIRFHPLGEVVAGSMKDDAGRGEVIPELPDIDLPQTVPAPDGGLSDLMPPGGLLGNDPFFGGTLIPTEGLADTVARAFEAFRSPVPPRPNVGSLIEGILGDDHDLPEPLEFQALNVARYTVKTVRHKPEGNVTTEYEVVPCEHAYYDTDQQDRVASPVSLAQHDMHVYLCPDLAAAANGQQKLDYELNALRSGIKVDVTTTYDTIAVTGKRVRIVTDAVATAHPTLFKMLLSSQPSGGGQTTNVVQTESNSLLEALTIWLDSANAAGEPVREGRVQIEKLAANSGHRYVIEGREGNEAGTESRLAVRLVDDAANGNETFLLDSYDTSNAGRLQARAELTGYPERFDTLVTVRTAPDGSGGQAPPEELVISGTQPAERRQVMRLSQWNGERRLGEVEVSSFADRYEYRAEVERDNQNRQNGVKIDAHFSQGPPVDGSFRIARYRGNETNGKDELDARVRVERFSSENFYKATASRGIDGRINGAVFSSDFSPQAPSAARFELVRFRRNDATQNDVPLTVFDASGLVSHTSLRAEVKGDPADPTGLHAVLTNNVDPVQQVIEILQSPAESPPSRVVLVGSGVDSSSVADPVDGQNLRWSAIPRKFTVDLDLTRQNGAPRSATVEVTDASEAPANSVLTLTDASGNETLGFTLKSPNSRHRVHVELEGAVTRPDSARIVGNSFGERPQSALQLFLRRDGNLVSQVRFMGPSATMTGLVPGTGSRLNGVATNVPERFEYGVEVETDAAGVPQHAYIKGSNSSFAGDMDVRLTDDSRGLDLHQRSFPAEYRYGFHSKFGQTGTLQGAAVSDQHESTNPNGLLDIRYRNFRLLIDSMTTTFRYDVDVEGDLASPRGAVLKQEQSSSNPDQNVQLIAYQPGTEDARAAVTLRNRDSAVLPQSASSLEAVWTAIPEDFTLTVGREEGPERGRARVRASLSDARSGAELRLSLHRGSQTQSVYATGLAKEFLARLRYVGEADDPKTLHGELASLTRNPTDVVQVVNREDGEVTQRITLRGHDGVAPVTTQGSKADVTFKGLPEGIVVDLERTKRQGHDVSYDVNLRNQEVGPALDDRTLVRNPLGVVEMNLKSGGASAEFVQLSDLPARIHLFYERPPVFVQADNDPALEENCLGTLEYDASDSGLDVRQSLDLTSNYNSPSEACIRGSMRAEIMNMPSQGFARAELLRDGNAVFRTRDNQVIGSIDITTGPPAGERAFLNKDIHVKELKLCPEIGYGTEHWACQRVTIDATPEFTDVKVRVNATGVRAIDLRTNYDESGNPKPFPGGDAIDKFVWENMPIIGVEYDGTGPMKLYVNGKDDQSVSGNALSQKIDCCFEIWPQRAFYEDSVSFDNLPLGVRFYGWKLTADDKKLNRSNELLDKTIGSYVRTHNPFGSLDPIPFHPRFIAEDSQTNSFQVLPGETVYFVPNPYDALMADVGDVNNPADRGRWFARNAFNIWQTDWFFQSMLHEIEPDVHGFND